MLLMMMILYSGNVVVVDCYERMMEKVKREVEGLRASAK